MIELIIATYGVLCWLLFAKFKLIPVTTYTVCTAILIGIVILLGLWMALSICHPVSHDGRLYSNVTQIVPEVRGHVVEVPVVADKPIRQGEVLFRIDPSPYQYEVDRLQALLAGKNARVAQLKEQLAGAEAATREAESNLLVAESQFDRQAREALVHAEAQVKQTQKRFDLAKKQYDRLRQLMSSRAASQEEFDRVEAHMLAMDAELQQAAADQKIADEKLKSGSSSLASSREEIKRAKAAENQVRVELAAQSDGVNPEVRQVMAELDNARWKLEQTTVRAPYDGYVPQVILRPGQMAVPFPLSPLMVYVSSDKPVLVATFTQNVVEGLKPGQHAEVAFRAYPGRVFQVRVKRILPAIQEGQLDVSGQLLKGTPARAPGHVPVLFEYDEDVTSLTLPIGAQGTVAVYTEHLHALSLVRKIILRVKSWENYAFALDFLGGH
jgi:multidrug resistance efflux pump